MNPPSALQSAMNRDRKPFTYLPGGLDLSEIKSQRMAQRLMRNAMNPGVSELPSQPASASTTPTTTLPVPNFNCLPVQVFPAFQLPANPKSLLRTRSNPDPKQLSFINPKSNTVKTQFEINKPVFPHSQVNNGALNSTKPDVCYENNSKPLQIHNNNPFEDIGCGAYLPKMEYITEYHNAKPLQELNNIILPSSYLQNSCKTADATKIPADASTPEVHNISSPPLLMTLDEDARNNEQKEIKIIKEETTKKISEQNGDAEAAVTVKLPSKKSEAQSETKVDVVKKTLPDGSVQEITTTTTTTTVDGRTEIKTRTQTKTFPKELIEEVEESEEEIEEENASKEDENKEKDDVKSSIITNEERSESTTTKKVTVVHNSSSETENDSEEIKKRESDKNDEHVQQSTSNVKIEEIDEEEITRPQENNGNIDDEQEEIEDEVIEDTQTKSAENEIVKENKDDSESEYEEIEEKENVEVVKTEPDKATLPPQTQDDESEYTEEEYESEIEEENKNVEKEVEKSESTQENKATEETEENDNRNFESEPAVEKQEKIKEPDLNETSNKEEKSESNEEESTEKSEVADTDEKSVEQNTQEAEKKAEEVHEIKVEVQQEAQEEKLSRPKVQFREPSVPLEKVEDVEIKPITGQDFVTKSTVEKTEIISSSNEQPTGILSKQTNYNRIENIVTVNRSTKTLDRQLDDLVHPSYLTGNNIAAPQVNKSYQPTYTPDPITERRHSLLLERLSVDRQLPITEVYQHPYSSQASEDKQWSEEPQSEVLTINNVKPSAITKNQQWYQYSKENVTNTNNYQNDQSTYQPWNQQPQPQIQRQYKPPHPHYEPAQPKYTVPQQQYQPPQQQYVPPQQPYQQPQPQYQPSQPQYQAKPQQYQQEPLFHRQPSPQPQPVYQTPPQYQTQPQAQYKPHAYQPQSLNKPEQSYQSSYTESRTQETKSSSTFSPNVQRSSHAVTSKPDWNSNTSSQDYNQSSQYSESTDFYTPKSYGSSYVPPPWEQDSKYATESNFNNYETSPVSGLSPTTNQSWTPIPKPTKFSKATPKAYIPPAPNQSFVKSATAAPPKVAGRKTYYSEYERRYISVPESTYVPNETKFQHQPDPSPVYYYNTEESSETAEPEWRKELREFTEKTTKTQTHIESSIRPPWEEEKAVKSAAYTPTPTWSQTLQPRSHRERSFESERYSSVQEWPKTNTIGRGRPLSTYEKSDYESPVQRVRGVSVDRYNPNNYQSPSPAEHPPVQSQTLTPQNAPHKHYHSQNVPAYHASRASAEPRDPPASYKQPRPPVDSRTPLQSRSFKYLQWITGTED